MTEAEIIQCVKDGLNRQKLFIALECVKFLEKENGQLKAQIEKMKCCENCDGWDYISTEHIEENVNYMTGIGLKVTRYNSKESIYFKIDSDSYSIVVDSPEKLELFVHALKIGRNQDTNSQTGKVFVLENMSEKDNTLFNLEVDYMACVERVKMEVEMTEKELENKEGKNED